MFTKQRSNVEYAALLDVGSGSVTVSIVCSNQKTNKVEMVWTHHERLLLKQVVRQNAEKPILTSVLNCLLTLSSEGILALRGYDKGAQLRTIQVGVSAPWTYTVTKTVRLKKDKPFLIKRSTIDDLRDAAEEKIRTEINENEIAQELELVVVTRSITEMRANDYPFIPKNNHRASSLSMTLSSVIIQNHLHNALIEGCEKILPNAQIQMYSSMLQTYFTLRDMYPEMREFCIVIPTLEATEIGLVRNGVLTYSTHEPYGIAHIAKDISEALNTPIGEVYGQLQADELTIQNDTLSQKAKAVVTEVFGVYRKRLVELFKQTGDDFTIPRSMFVLKTGRSQQPLVQHIEAAAETSTGFKHIVHPIIDGLTLTPDAAVSDTSIECVSGHFFHRFGFDTRFTFL